MAEEVSIASATTASYKWFVLAVTGVGTFCGALDGSIVNITNPLIQQQFHASIGTESWVATAYLLVVCSMLLTFGRVGDMWGYKDTYLIGFGVFGLGSLLCGIAPTLGLLVGARVVQGLGAAMIMAIGPALLTSSFPPSERGRGLGLMATLTYTGLTVGPSLGGAIAGQWGWHWIFLVNVPLAAAGAVLGAMWLKPSTRKIRQRFDLLGAALLAAGLTAILLALSQGEAWGWGSPATLGLIAAGVILLVLFVWQERRIPEPMMPLWLLRNFPLSVGIVTAFIQYVVGHTLLFLLPFYLLDFRQFDPGRAGLIMTAQPVIMVSISALAGWLSDRVGARGPVTAGLGAMAVGLFLVSRSGSATPQTVLMGCLALVGLGSGLFAAPNNSAIMGAAPRDRQGIASGLLAAARNMGMATGIALGGSLFAYLQGWLQQQGAGGDGAFLTAFGRTLLVASVLALVGAVVSFLRPKQQRVG